MPATAQLLAQRFDFSPYRTFADIGGADGDFACTVAQHHPRLQCATLDLPAATAAARRHIERRGLASRVSAQPLDCEADPFPRSDVITLGTSLRDGDRAKKLLLMRKACNALPVGGCLIAIDECDDDFAGWAKAVGFRRTAAIALAGPAHAAVAYK
jgi:hypothetical protein